MTITFLYSQNDDEAFKWLSRSAKHECSSGQNNLGNCFHSGRGCSVNMASARYRRPVFFDKLKLIYSTVVLFILKIKYV
jgi:hypothetical protein